MLKCPATLSPSRTSQLHEGWKWKLRMRSWRSRLAMISAWRHRCLPGTKHELASLKYNICMRYGHMRSVGQGWCKGRKSWSWKASRRKQLQKGLLGRSCPGRGRFCGHHRHYHHHGLSRHWVVNASNSGSRSILRSLGLWLGSPGVI